MRRPTSSPAARRAEVFAPRLRYEISDGLATIKGMCFGVFFIDAPWSGPSRTSFARLTEAIAKLDKNRQLELVVVGIDESPGLAEIPELRNRIGGWGETAWVFRGRILKTANNGRDVEPNTIELLAHERRPVQSAPGPQPSSSLQLPSTTARIAVSRCTMPYWIRGTRTWLTTSAKRRLTRRAAGFST
jgi:hypothetical protein